MVQIVKRYGKGLFIGRFQPFHKGHLSKIKSIKKLCRELVIGIGSSQSYGTRENPFSAKLRLKIIKVALKSANVDKKGINFIIVPDFGSDEDWFECVDKLSPNIDVVFSGNPWVKKVFKRHNIIVVNSKRANGISGTKVRKLIRECKNWEGLVPQSVLKEIKFHEAVIKG